MSGCSGDTTSFTQEAPLEPETPSNGTAIIVEASEESSVGLSYTNVSDNSILVTCGDDCNLTVNEAEKVVDEAVEVDDNETEEE